MSSKALPFLIIAALVLAGAAVWKFTAKEEAEKPVFSTEQKVEKTVVEPVAVQQPNTEVEPVTEEIVIEDYDEPEASLPIITEEEFKERKATASAQMTFAMRYRTADKAIDALRLYKKNGNERMATDLLEYIRISFPNTSIPSELLD